MLPVFRDGATLGSRSVLCRQRAMIAKYPQLARSVL
jgi:hypothetical protein